MFNRVRNFFLFSTKNQVPKIIIGMGRVIYHIKALPVLIRTTSKKFPSIVKHSWKKVDLYSEFERAGLQ